MPLSEAERVDIRRFCGFPAYSSGSIVLRVGLYHAIYGNLERRLSVLTAEETVIVRRYLGAIAALEAAVPAAADNMSTNQAATWTRNEGELAERIRLFDTWRRRLCGFLGVPPGPDLSCGRGKLIV